MGRQINHEGINNKMMGTETVEPVTQYDILEGQCGAANDKIIVPEEGECERLKKLLKLLPYLTEDDIENLICQLDSFEREL